MTWHLHLEPAAEGETCQAPRGRMAATAGERCGRPALYAVTVPTMTAARCACGHHLAAVVGELATVAEVMA